MPIGHAEVEDGDAFRVLLAKALDHGGPAAGGFQQAVTGRKRLGLHPADIDHIERVAVGCINHLPPALRIFQRQDSQVIGHVAEDFIDTAVNQRPGRIVLITGYYHVARTNVLDIPGAALESWQNRDGKLPITSSAAASTCRTWHHDRGPLGTPRHSRTPASCHPARTRHRGHKAKATNPWLYY